MSAGSVINKLPQPIRRVIRRFYYRRIVKAYRESDWEWSPVVMPLIPEGGVVFDIGANVGYLSKLFAERVGKDGSVFSAEPIPDTHDALSSSMKSLYPGVVTVYQCCISSESGSVEMVVPTYEGGGENFYESHIKTGGETATSDRTFRVDAFTLDQLVEKAGVKPDFIKIDVEGHELAVVQGGQGLLQQNGPPLLIEVTGDPDDSTSSAAALFEALKQLNYEGHTLTGGGYRPRRQGDKEVDYLFISAAANTAA